MKNIENSNNLKKAFQEYQKIKKTFDKQVKANDVGIDIFERDLKKHPELYGDISLTDKQLSASQLLNRSKLFEGIVKENNYLESLRGHANLFSKNSKRNIDNLNDSTGKERSSLSDPGNSTHQETKKRKLGGIHPSSTEDKSNYRESFVVSDELPSLEKYKERGDRIESLYQEKMKKIVDENLDQNTISNSRRVSFESNYVLQKQLHELKMIQSGKNSPFYEHSKTTNKPVQQVKKVFKDIPNASGELRDGQLKINSLTPKSKRKDSTPKH